MKRTLRDLIDDGRVHVFDGAMGTELYKKGVFINVCYDELNLQRPDLIKEVHKAYIDAGAELIESNTFGANPVKLAGHGLAGETEAINEKAAAIAREVAGDEVSVVGAMGPLGIRIEPFGQTAREEAFELFLRQARGLLSGGVDGFVLETFSVLEEIHQALLAVRSICDLPVIAQMTVSESGKTAYGTEVEVFATRLAEWEADVVGINCSVGPSFALSVLERMVKVIGRPISVLPNAGLPKEVGGRKIYLASPEYMAEYGRRMIEAGAKFVGGCCGTTPEHIKALHTFVASVSPRQTTVVVHHDELAPEAVEPPPLGLRSRWGGRLARAEMVTSVEIVPPRGTDPKRMLEQCRLLKVAGVDAVNVPDGPRAQSRMGALLSALMIEREVGIEAVVHYCCRDRNLLGMLSDLLGAYAAGLRNVLIITGDPPKMGPYPDATAVFDIDSIGLTNLVYRLNHGLDPGNNKIGDPTQFVIGVGVNPAAVDLTRELKRFYWKADAGAEFAVTQPVFDPDQFESFRERVAKYEIPIVAGIWPLISLRNAEFLANEVPGVSVPEAILKRMATASEKGKEAALAEGVTIAREMVARVTPMVQGIQVSAPFGRVKVALEVIGS
ncbi:bifunctional homocysteine S-methyltransferase/methylenetetrahydrofolate reductase [Planctomycetota bacterium]